MQFGGLHFDRASAVLIGGTLFNDGHKLIGGGFPSLFEVEATGPLAEVQLTVQVSHSRRVVFLQKLRKHRAVSTIKGVKPGGELMSGWCVRNVSFGNRCESGDCQERNS